MPRARAFLCALAALALAGTGAHPHRAALGSMKFSAGAGPYLAGSRIPLEVTDASGRMAFTLYGPGTIASSQLIVPQVSRPESVSVAAATEYALAYQTFNLVPAPPLSRPIIAVSSYDDGIALHDARTFALIGYLAIGGAPADVAIAKDGRIGAADTDGDAFVTASRDPWDVNTYGGVPLGNEVAFAAGGDAFISDRDVQGMGALTRVDSKGAVTRVVTGVTAEGLAVDERSGRIYVGNVNDNSVAAVDMKSMHVVQKIASVPRTFGLALDTSLDRLFVVANVDAEMRSGSGMAAAIDLRRGKNAIVARSGPMKFPLGAAVDRVRRRLFVTDESADVVYVLDERTLKSVRAPLATCETPWRPRVAGGRIYVPCARANDVDVFDAATLRRVKGAPFATGGFPTSVALWP